MTVILAGPRLALAGDGGHGVTTADGGAGSSDAGGGDEGRPQEDASNGADAAPIVACDGALCDSTQGRPSCTFAPAPRAGSGAMTCAALAVAAGVVRRRRRRAFRPASYRPARIFVPATVEEYVDEFLLTTLANRNHYWIAMVRIDSDA
jgi:hypothetical protein